MTNNKLKHIKLLTIDADDTLWENQVNFEAAQHLYCKLLRPWADEQTVRDSLYKVECRNMPLTGYGTKAFTLSLVENAIEITDNKIPAEKIQEILKIGYAIMNLPVKLLPGVLETMEQLYKSQKYYLVCFTKGDAKEQEDKFFKSGISELFSNIIVTSDKQEWEFRRLCVYYDVKPEQILSIGNSFKADIHPIVTLGGWGVHIPYKRMWQYDHIEEYQHPHVLHAQQFADILQWL